MDPITCCLLGICCPPFSAKQRELFVKALAGKVGEHKASAIADDLFLEFAAITAKIAEAAK
jgi:hypothetical protein